MPPCANGLHHGGQGSVGWGKDEEIGQLAWIVEAAAKDEPMASVHRAPMHHGQARPGKEALPFGAQTLGETLPIAPTQSLLRKAGDITEQQA